MARILGIAECGSLRLVIVLDSISGDLAPADAVFLFKFNSRNHMYYNLRAKRTLFISSNVAVMQCGE